MQTQQPVDKLKFSAHLEKASKDYFRIENAEDRLAERVEAYTTWDGELNEIVHHTRKGVTGRDVLINIMLSDDEGSTNNKDIIFGFAFQYIGIKIGINETDEYCVVLDYASHLGNESYREVMTPRKYLCYIIFI